MKKILYFIALFLLYTSCNDANKTRNLKDYGLYQISDTIDIDTCSDDVFTITQGRINAQGIKDYIYYNDTVILLRDTLWSFNHKNDTTFYVYQYSTKELKQFIII